DAVVFSSTVNGATLVSTGRSEEVDRRLGIWGPNGDLRVWDRDSRVSRTIRFAGSTVESVVALGDAALVQRLVVRKADGTEPEREDEGTPLAPPVWDIVSLSDGTSHRVAQGHLTFSR